ncbi:hypothetical protein [Oryzifoliimicrobium ureilyticus]|uniref:hypothetical protein n=1 Tax=Oryzifoliimicrobium ureilyticus TaxID=3113724 RepID=UPI00307678D5
MADEKTKPDNGDKPVKTEDKTSSPKLFPVRLKVDYWPLDDARQPAGEVISLELEHAKALIAQSKAERADELGEAP